MLHNKYVEHRDVTTSSQCCVPMFVIDVSYKKIVEEFKTMAQLLWLSNGAILNLIFRCLVGIMAEASSTFAL